MTKLVCTICARNLDSPGMACDSCRRRLDSTLVEIGNLHAELPDHLERGQTNGQRVSGSREAPLPLRVEPLDLSMPARAGSVVDDVVQQYDVVERTINHTYFVAQDVGMWITDEVHVWQKRPKTKDVDGETKPVLGPAGDQVGHQSVLTLLDSWVRDWRDTRDMREHLPVPAGASLVSWLRTRLDWACDHHTAIDAFNQEMRDLRGALRKALGVSDTRPELLDVPCRKCEWRSLAHLPGEDRVECGHCGDLSTLDEYKRWIGLLTTGIQDGVVPVDPDVLLLGEDAAMLARVKPELIRLWASRGLLRPAGRTPRGRPLYRAGDVKAVELATRTGAVAKQVDQMTH